jgi:hypothetical protein
MLYASELLIDALRYGELPFSVFVVEGEPIKKYDGKAGFKELKIVREMPVGEYEDAFYRFMIWVTKNLNGTFENKKEIMNRVKQTVMLFTDSLNTGKMDTVSVYNVIYAIVHATVRTPTKRRELSERLLDFLKG